MQEPKVELTIKEGHLNIASNLSSPINTMQFLLGAVSAILQGITPAQEEAKIIVPNLTTPRFGGK